MNKIVCCLLFLFVENGFHISIYVCLYLNVTDGIEKYVVKYLNRMYSNLSVTIYELSVSFLNYPYLFVFKGNYTT